MFKGISINLSGPICQCQKDNLEWSTIWGGGLVIQCGTCKIQLVVPHEKFVACFRFDTPYPQQKTRAQEKDSRGERDGQTKLSN